MASEYAKNLLLRTNIASLVWGKGVSNRVYYQGNGGAIHEIAYDSGASWYGGDGKVIVPASDCMLGSPLAAIQWGSGGGLQLRVYYMSPVFQIREKCWDGKNGWYDGALNGARVTPAPYSQLSAIVWLSGGAPQIRVYYQGTDNKILEYCWGGSWTVGSTLPGNPLQGTSIAFLQRSLTETPSIRGYIQEHDLTLNELCWDGKWTTGTRFHGNRKVPFRTTISCTVASPAGGSGQPQQMRVYFANEHRKVIEYLHHNGWSAEREVPHIIIVPAGRVSCASFPRDGNPQADVRLYANMPLNIIMEGIYRQGVWENIQSLGTTMAVYKV